MFAQVRKIKHEEKKSGGHPARERKLRVRLSTLAYLAN
jgi:hypothetical protein